MLFVYNIWLLQLLSSPWDKKLRIINVGNIVLIMYLILSFVRIDNLCYLKAAFTQQQAINYYNTLVTRIKSTDGYSDLMPVVFYGKSNIMDLSIKDIPEFEIVKLAPYGSLEYYINDYANLKFMHLWCGYEPSIANNIDTLQSDTIFYNMPSYPKAGSIQIVNDVLYVKLGDK
jgi:hypothetical protein